MTGIFAILLDVRITTYKLSPFIAMPTKQIQLKSKRNCRCDEIGAVDKINNRNKLKQTHAREHKSFDSYQFSVIVLRNSTLIEAFLFQFYRNKRNMKLSLLCKYCPNLRKKEDFMDWVHFCPTRRWNFHFVE